MKKQLQKINVGTKIGDKDKKSSSNPRKLKMLNKKKIH